MTDPLTAAAKLVQQHYQYRNQATGQVLNLTPAKAAWYAERYDVTLDPLTTAPLAPAGKFEKGWPMSAESPVGR